VYMRRWASRSHWKPSLFLPNSCPLASGFMDLQEMRKAHSPGQLENSTTGNEDEDGEEGLTPVPPISLDEANLRLTALLCLLGTTTVTELPTNARRFRLKMCSISPSDSESHCASTVRKNKIKNKAICLPDWLL